MRIFLDTANLEEIRTAVSWGVIDGITTNPTLLAKEGGKFEEQISKILGIVDGEISVEIMSSDVEEMVKEAVKIHEWSPNIVIKVSMSSVGMKVVRRLGMLGINTNVTLVFSSTQALLAAKAGATYVSPFVGRLDDIGCEGMQVVKDIITIFDMYDYDTEVIVASVRHPLHVIEAMKIGADVVTIPFTVLEKMFHHPLTDIGIQKFLEDWRKVSK